MFNAPVLSQQKTGTPGKRGTHLAHRAVVPRHLLIFPVARLLLWPSVLGPGKGPGMAARTGLSLGAPLTLLG